MGKNFLQCDYCGLVIMDGEPYYDFDGGCVCENCVDDAIKEYRRYADYAGAEIDDAYSKYEGMRDCGF